MGQDNQWLFACNFLNAGAHHTKIYILGNFIFQKTGSWLTVTWEPAKKTIQACSIGVVRGGWSKVRHPPSLPRI